MPTCREMAASATEYAEGALPLRERLRFRAHLLRCRACRAYLRQLRIAARAVGLLPAPEVPPAALGDLLSRFEAWARRTRG